MNEEISVATAVAAVCHGSEDNATQSHNLQILPRCRREPPVKKDKALPYRNFLFAYNKQGLLATGGTSGMGAINEEPKRDGVFEGTDLEGRWRTSGCALEAFLDPQSFAQREDHHAVGELWGDCSLHG